MKNTKTKDILGIGKLAVGAIFLFNPTINILDPLPDFIGYWLTVLGLTAFAYLSEEIFIARKYFIYLTLITAIKTVVNIAVPFTSDTFTVTAALIFAVAEAVFFIPAMSGLINSLSSFGLRYGRDAGFYVPVAKSRIKKVEKLEKEIGEISDREKKEKLERKKAALLRPATSNALKVLTVIAFLVRAAGYIVPVLPALSMQGITYFPASGTLSAALFTGPLYVLVWIVGFAVCIPWLKMFWRYIKGIVSDGDFCSAVYEKYEKDILSNTGRLTAERMKKVMILASIAVCTTLYLPIDNVNALPGLITAGFLISAFVYMRVYGVRAAYTGIGICAAWAVISLNNVLLQLDYVSRNYKPASALHGIGQSEVLYAKMEYFAFAEAILFAAAAIIFARLFMKTVREHVGLLTESRVSYMGGEKKILACLKPVAILGAIVIVLSPFVVFTLKYFAASWLIYALFVIAFSILSILAYFKLDDRVYLSLRRKF
ncbi:MAG: hypothetical protein IJA52_00620 [Clostridia bacterium]|nr:hypothetical protein [Clostridia bacterium]